MNNINSLEDKVANLLEACLRTPIDQNNIEKHPIRIIESVKSLIGLDLNNPNKNLINFLDQITITQDSNDSISDKIDSETVSIYQLKDAIEASDYNMCKDLVANLVKLSDGNQILEFLLELSLLQTGKSTLLVWATYKSIKFINNQSNENMKFAILLCCKSLIIDNHFQCCSEQKKTIDDIYNNYNLQLHELQVIGALFEISKANLIRSDKINLNITKFLSFFFSTIRRGSKISKDSFLENNIDKKDILNALSDNIISHDLILSLNGIRSCMRYSSLKNNVYLQLYIDKVKEENR